MKIEIAPFDGTNLLQAGVLLAERQRAIRRRHPRLPEPFDHPANATEKVTTLAGRPNIFGASATSQGKLRAYLLAERVTDMLWGRSVWMRFPGIGVGDGVDREIIRDLYAKVTAPLVLQGCLNHFAVVPVADMELVHAFFSLAFGIEQIHGIVDLHEIPVGPPELPDGVMIRQAGSEDRELLASLFDTIWKHQVKPPVWGINLPETEPDRKKAYADMADDKDAIVYIAFVDDKPAGLQGYFPPDPDDKIDMFCWPDGLELCVGGTREEYRGRGVATALTQFAFYAAREAGCRYILTDWRSTNLLSSRFWPKRGFVPVAYRLSRRIDDRILWAGERRG